jgi:ERCC4-type nuclease
LTHFAKCICVSRPIVVSRSRRLAYSRRQAAGLGISRSTLRSLIPYVETIEMPWGGKPMPVTAGVRQNPLVARAKPAPVRIIVDVHERQSGIAETLAELGAEVEFASLPAGDYAVGADTLVERKRVLDLHGAVLKGRLWPQLGKLRAACAFPYLLVEGTDIDRGPLHHNAVRGVCLAAIDQGVALLRSGYQRDSALWIHRLAVRCQQVEPAAERPAYAQRPRPKPGAETAEALLASVPGISTSSARALLDRFGSVAAVVAADPAEWLEVPGIGPERARALEETFALRRSPSTLN